MIPKTILENISLNLGIDNMYLAMPEIFIFCSTLILMLLDIFFFKEKSFKNTNKFGISIILLSFILTLFLPTNGVGFNNLYNTTYDIIYNLVWLCVVVRL